MDDEDSSIEQIAANALQCRKYPKHEIAEKTSDALMKKGKFAVGMVGLSRVCISPPRGKEREREDEARGGDARQQFAQVSCALTSLPSFASA